jgi:RNA polymerase sigma factor (TIGR02999 family)
MNSPPIPDAAEHLPGRCGSNADAGPASAQELLPALYQELRRLAQHRLAQEHGGHTLQATELVHEAWLRLNPEGARDEPSWNGKRHFFAAAAEAMRRVLIDRARQRNASKRGGGMVKVTLCDSGLAAPVCGLDSADLIDLGAAIDRFATVDETKALLAKLHIFAGLDLKEAAGLLDISYPTAKRYWTFAQAWLTRELRGT